MINLLLGTAKTEAESPAVVKDATADYLAAEDAVGQWITECCVTGRQYWTSRTVLFDSYVSWCRQNGEQPNSQKRLSQHLGSRGYAPHRRASEATLSLA